MRSHESGVEAPKVAKVISRVAAAALVGGIGLGLAGCGNGSASGGSAVKGCKDGWETLSSETDNPSEATTSMQEGIAKLIDEIDSTSAKSNNGFLTDKIPQNLVGAATGVLTHYSDSIYLQRSSGLQNYSNEVCEDEITGRIYLTPDYLSAVGSLAAAGIEVQPDLTLDPGVPTPSSNPNKNN